MGVLPAPAVDLAGTDQAAVREGCLSLLGPLDLVRQLGQLALQLVRRSHGIAGLPLATDLSQPHAVHERLDVSSIKHTGHRSSFDAAPHIPFLGYPGYRSGLPLRVRVKLVKLPAR